MKKTQKVVKFRPLPSKPIPNFVKIDALHDWSEVYSVEGVDEKVNNFHQTLRTWLDIYFPEKSVTLSNLDKKWMTPSLKIHLRKMQREYIKNGKSEKFLVLRRKFRKIKCSNVRNNFSDIFSQLKRSKGPKILVQCS